MSQTAQHILRIVGYSTKSLQPLPDLQEYVLLRFYQLLAFGRVVIVVPKAAMGVFGHDRVRVPARVYQRIRKVDKKDLFPFHDEMAQVEHRIVHHSCLMDLAQRQHRQTAVHATHVRQDGAMSDELENSANNLICQTHQNSSGVFSISVLMQSSMIRHAIGDAIVPPLKNP